MEGIDIKRLREARHLFEDTKHEYGDACQKIIEYARFLGFEAGEKADARQALAYLEGFLRCLELQRSH